MHIVYIGRYRTISFFSITAQFTLHRSIWIYLSSPLWWILFSALCCYKNAVLNITVYFTNVWTYLEDIFLEMYLWGHRTYVFFLTLMTYYFLERCYNLYFQQQYMRILSYLHKTWNCWYFKFFHSDDMRSIIILFFWFFFQV